MNEETVIEGGEETTVVIDDSPEAGIEALRQQMSAAEEGRKSAERERDEARRAGEAEREAREEAERRAQHANAEAQRGAHSAFEAQYDSIINAHAAAVGELASHKNALQTAMSEGDFAKVADLSAEIGVTASRVRQYEEGKAALEAQRQRNGQAATAQPPYQTPSDQREQFLQSRTPKTAAWLRRNDRYFTDSTFRLGVSGAHNLAVSRGIQPDSDDYFRFIEEQSGLRSETPAAASTAATATAARYSPTPAAPAAGSTPSATRPSNTGGTVTLSADEREICRTTGISEAAYAKQKMELIKEGRYATGH